jgi:hypothetical protein
MTPKEKAKELVGKFYVNIPLRDCDNKRPHKLALIAVDLHLEELSKMKLIFSYREIHYKYWQQVKQEIELL